jgi:thiamine pyrophosphate-dependent acetolactate synthase large subunit-like protein
MAAETIADPAAVPDALRRAFAAGKPMLLDVVVDGSV